MLAVFPPVSHFGSMCLFIPFICKILIGFALGLLRFLLAMGCHGTNSTVLDPSANTQLSISCWIFSSLDQLFCLISVWGFYAAIHGRMTGIPRGFLSISQLLLCAANVVMCQVQWFIELSCFLGFQGLSINIKVQPLWFLNCLVIGPFSKGMWCLCETSTGERLWRS